MKKVLTFLLPALLLPLVAAQGLDSFYYGVKARGESGTIYNHINVMDHFINEYKLEGHGLVGITEAIVDLDSGIVGFQQKLRMSDTVVGEYGSWFRQDIVIDSSNYQKIRWRTEATGSPTEPDRFGWDEVIQIDLNTSDFGVAQEGHAKGDYIDVWAKTHSDDFGFDWTTDVTINDGSFDWGFGLSGSL